MSEMSEEIKKCMKCQRSKLYTYNSGFKYICMNPRNKCEPIYYGDKYE